MKWLSSFRKKQRIGWLSSIRKMALKSCNIQDKLKAILHKLLSMIPVERALKQNFDENGVRRPG